VVFYLGEALRRFPARQFVSPCIPLPKGDEPAARLRYAIRCLRYSVHTEESYVFWVNRFLAFCRDGGVEQDADAVRAFLERLVVRSLEDG
jgi:hypothetical protein